MSSMRHLSRTTSGTEWARRGIAVFLVLHGIAHLVGAQAAIGAAGDGDAVELLFGSIEATGAWAGALAVAWIALAVGFTVAAAWLWTLHERWWGTAVVVVGASLALSALTLPQAVAGVAINLVLLAVAVLVRRDAGKVLTAPS